MHFVRPGKLSTKTPTSFVHKEWAGEWGAARASAWVSAPARNCSSVVRNRSGSRRATCKDRLLHSCRFDSTFLHSFSPRGRWASSGVFLHFAPPTRTRGKQSRSLFDFAAFALLRGRENGYYELTSGTMRYARPTNASGNNARSRAISTAAAANMNNLVRIRMLSSRCIAVPGVSRAPLSAIRHTNAAKVHGMPSVNRVLFLLRSIILTALTIYIGLTSVNLKVELTRVNSFQFLFSF